ncbi:tetratricopeptide repeat protein [uncultured Photobacterium sp.]|uniref:tetratricopeptide repeat protein n=1 Tax=uncultured Photobacterium sp. TaxID=173973 RepID=UPI0026185440|nr:tetratricopeptide repeat protein [uncultured Photobacterium sp.]
MSAVTIPVIAATDVIGSPIITDHDEQSVYDDGYNNGYEQALAEEHQKQVSPPIKSELSIETVSLTASELAKVEYLNAEKALEQQNSKQAALNLESALYYRPDWVMARQKLAALYYGMGNIQEATATLERGLATQPNQADLRLTLAKLLINESQFQAALTVLDDKSGYMSIQYLAMRGALAQQLNNNNIALACYQQLIQRAPKDGRWWLGLAIVQERIKAINKALASYHQALAVGNISSSSQLFIQQRLNAIKQQH